MEYTRKINETENLNKTNKKQGIRNFLKCLEIDFVGHIVPATRRGAGISCLLSGLGGIDTLGYILQVITMRGRTYRVIENNKIIKKGIMREFNSKETYSLLTYSKQKQGIQRTKTTS